MARRWLLRALFALLVSLLGAHVALIYRLAALPCLARARAARSVARDRPAAAPAVASGGRWRASPAPPTRSPTRLQLGHPEELLGPRFASQPSCLHSGDGSLGRRSRSVSPSPTRSGRFSPSVPSSSRPRPGAFALWRSRAAVAAALLLPIIFAMPVSATGTTGRLAVPSGTDLLSLADLLAVRTPRRLEPSRGHLHPTRLPPAAELARQPRAPADHRLRATADMGRISPPHEPRRRAAVARAALARALLA